MRRRRLLPAPWRPLALLTWIVAALVLAVLADHFAQGATGDRADAVVGARLQARLAAHTRLLTASTRLGSPAVVVGASVALALLCLAAHRRRAALFALLAAPMAGAITEYVLKPVVHRESPGNVLVFPSGHTTGAFALALTVVVLLLPREGTPVAAGVVRILLALVALAAATLVAVAVVALGWHYVTDTIGGAATAVVVVVALAAAVDALPAPVAPRA